MQLYEELPEDYHEELTTLFPYVSHADRQINSEGRLTFE